MKYMFLYYGHLAEAENAANNAAQDGWRLRSLQAIKLNQGGQTIRDVGWVVCMEREETTARRAVDVDITKL